MNKKRGSIMSSKNILLYCTLYVLATLFNINCLYAGEDLENWKEKSPKRGIATKLGYSDRVAKKRPSILISPKNSFPETIFSHLERNATPQKIVRPLNKQLLTFPIELCTVDLNTLLQKKPTIIQELLATLIKEEKTSTLKISENSKITAVFRFEVSRLQTNQNPLVRGRKNDSRIGNYALYEEEDLIPGTCLEIRFAWPK
jgi:hypothetical protein